MTLARLTLLYSALIAFLMAAAYVWSVKQRSEVRAAEYATDMKLRIVAASNILENELADVVAQLQVLSDMPAWRQRSGPPEGPYLAQIVDEFSRVAHYYPYLDQLRWVDTRGMERVRINQSPGGPDQVPEHQLQDKSARYYVREANQLARDEIYVSPFDLNVERGQIEAGNRAMLRLAHRVADRDDNDLGIIIINYSADELLAHYAQMMAGGTGHSMLVDSDGRYLFRDDGRGGWDRLLQRDERFATRYPTVWAAMQRKTNGRVANRDGLFHFHDLTLRDARLGQPKAGQGPWWLVSHIPIERVRPDFRQRSHLLVFALLLFTGSALGLPVAWLHRKVREGAQHRHENEQLMSSLFDQAPDAILLVSEEGHILRCNRRAEALFDDNKSALVGSPVETLIPHPFRRQHVQHRAAFARHARQRAMGAGLSLRAVDSKDREFPVDVMLSPIRTSDGTAIIAIVRDITERVQAERAQARYQALVDSSSDAILAKDRAGIVTNWNKGAERLFGYSAAEMIGTPASILFDPDTRVATEDRHEQVNHGTPVIDWRTTRIAKDGRKLRVAVTLSPIRNEQGAIVGSSSIARDITDQERQETRLRQALAEKEVLLAEIHHRVKNNLQVIYSLLDLQTVRVKDPLTLAMLSDSKHRVRTMALIHQTLYQSKQFATLSFAEYLQRLLDELRSSLATHGVDLSLQADPVRLGLETAIPCGLLVNELVSNAFKHAFPAGGAGHVLVKLVDQGGDRVMLEVKDDGVGLPAAMLTTPLGSGGSLGLQLVQILTEQLGGEVRAQSRNHQYTGAGAEGCAGTCFQVSFKVQNQPDQSNLSGGSSDDAGAPPSAPGEKPTTVID